MKSLPEGEDVARSAQQHSVCVSCRNQHAKKRRCNRLHATWRAKGRTLAVSQLPMSAPAPAVKGTIGRESKRVCATGGDGFNGDLVQSGYSHRKSNSGFVTVTEGAFPPGPKRPDSSSVRKDEGVKGASRNRADVSEVGPGTATDKDTAARLIDPECVVMRSGLARGGERGRLGEHVHRGRR
eukprot:scaffold122858_cov33-Tisochrysis_lutea.AAC.3